MKKARKQARTEKQSKDVQNFSLVPQGVQSMNRTRESHLGFRGAHMSASHWL